MLATRTPNALNAQTAHDVGIPLAPDKTSLASALCQTLMVMAGPVKRRKKNDSTPQKQRNLDYFFATKTRQASKTTPLEPVLKTSSQELTDEKYARKLAEEWAKEDGAAGAHPDENETANGEGSSARAGAKRRRSNSQEARDIDLARELLQDGAETKALENPSTLEEATPGNLDKPNITPPTPTKTAISLQTATEIDETIESIPFDSDPIQFEPDAYREIVENWPDGKATYALLTRAFVLVNLTRSRIKIVDTLVNFLRLLIRFDPESLLPAIWLTTNDIGPPYENNEFGLGGSIISKALIKTSGITPAALKKLYNKHGDPGDVAFEAKVKQRTLMMRKPAPLTIKNVYQTLVQISTTSGKGSQETKLRHVSRLLVSSKGEEIRYLTRTLIHHLRIGAVKTTMLIALSRAFTLSSPLSSAWSTPPIPTSKEERTELFMKAEEVVKQCFARRPNYNEIVPSLLRGGLTVLEQECGMALHIPLKPMLGSITRDLEEMLQKLQNRGFSCEYKYDGQRAQIHCDDSGKVSIFSRHLELMTDKYPDLVALVPEIRGPGVKSFILEGEVVAVDQITGEVKPFQILAGRERKNVEIGNVKVEVCLFAFDLMFLNGEELLSKSFRQRRELLRSKFLEKPNHFTWVKSLDATSTESDTVRGFFKSALETKCEGIMVKVLDNIPAPVALTAEEKATISMKKVKEKEKEKASKRKALLATYEPDKRLESWLKVKKDYDSAAADTLDLVPIAAWHGSGRKSKWWSPILLAVRNPSTGSFEAVCKCMSGFTDAYYTSMKEFYSPDGDNTSTTKKGYYETSLKPAIWFEPKEVWEVAFADITLSPTYEAALGLVSDEQGLSLRFPRFLRKRLDKGVEDASTPEFLADLYFKQGQTIGKGKKSAVEVEEHEEEAEEAEAEIGESDDEIERKVVEQ